MTYSNGTIESKNKDLHAINKTKVTQLHRTWELGL